MLLAFEDAVPDTGGVRLLNIIKGHVLTPVIGGDVLDIPRGAVAWSNGAIVDVGPVEEVLRRNPGAASTLDHGERLIIPGLIDTHVHFPQIGMIASPGHELLQWLEQYTFPAEAAFANDVHCDTVADFFTDQLIANGVTTACVYGTVHPGSVDALFRHARTRGLRIISGKVCMDRNAPDELLDTPDSAAQQSLELYHRWHGVDRLEYAITPRFAPTSSDAQLQALGELASSLPDVPIQTHLSENSGECAWVSELFPWATDYTDVYEKFGLVRRRSVFGHAIHLSDSELSRLGAAEASLAHCPTSNFFLGSGIFGVNQAQKYSGLHVGLGSDVGAGTSLNPLATCAAAYQASRMIGSPLSATELLTLATLSSAEALGVGKHVGSLEPGKDADLVVLDPESSPVLRNRADNATTTAELLFALMMLGDDRAIAEVIVAGRRVN